MATEKRLIRYEDVYRYAFEGVKCGNLAEEDFDAIVNAIESVPTVDWIPVGERKPDLIPCDAGTAYSEAVIVCTSGKKIMVAVWDGIDFLCDMDYWEAWGEQITHWVPIDWLLPLPELPKEDS